jgi:hypothetical protein
VHNFKEWQCIKKYGGGYTSEKGKTPEPERTVILFDAQHDTQFDRQLKNSMNAGVGYLRRSQTLDLLKKCRQLAFVQRTICANAAT